MRMVLRIVLIVGFVSVVVIAGLEAGLRVLDIPPKSNQIPHPVLNHTWRPNMTFVHREFAGRGIPPYAHTYNSQAWLEAHDIQQAKPSGTFRIFYLGDSFTECTCPMEQSVPRRVESALRPYFAQKGLAVEVVNTGTSSYAPSLYYLVLKEILPYEPDLIVIDVDLTDVFDDWIYRSSAQFDASGDLIAVPPRGRLTNRFIRTAQGLRELTPLEKALNSAREHSNLANILFTLKTVESDPAPAANVPTSLRGAVRSGTTRSGPTSNTPKRCCGASWPWPASVRQRSRSRWCRTSSSFKASARCCRTRRFTTWPRTPALHTSTRGRR